MLTDTTLASDHATLKMLGERLAGHRLRRNLTQDRLAGMAGVSRVTLARMEAGHPMQVVNLLRVLRALDMLGSIEALVPDPAISPVDIFKRERAAGRRAGPKRRRARIAKADTKRVAEPWI